MNTLVNEDTRTTRVSCNPKGSAIDAKVRAELAMQQHEDFFSSDEHMDRVEAVCSILKGFFGHNPNFITPRGINRKRPFDNIKMQQVGWYLNRFRAEEKNQRLYKPLLDLGNVEVVSKNGHLIVRVY